MSQEEAPHREWTKHATTPVDGLVDIYHGEPGGKMPHQHVMMLNTDPPVVYGCSGTSCMALLGPFTGLEAVNGMTPLHDQWCHHQGCVASEVVSTGHESQLVETVTCRNSTIADGCNTASYLVGYTLMEELVESTDHSNEYSVIDDTRTHAGNQHCYSSAHNYGSMYTNVTFLYDTTGKLRTEYSALFIDKHGDIMVHQSNNSTSILQQSSVSYFANQWCTVDGSSLVNSSRLRSLGTKFCSL